MAIVLITMMMVSAYYQLNKNGRQRI